MKKLEKTICGIDLGGSKGKSTAMAFVTAAHPLPRLRQLKLGLDDESILHLLREKGEALTVLAIDSPLKFPVCVRCRRRLCPSPRECKDDIVQEMLKKGACPYTQRLAEVELKERYGIRPMPTIQLGPIVARAEHLLKRLPSVGFDSSLTVLEVYPKATLFLLKEPLGLSRDDIKAYKDLLRGMASRERLLTKLKGLMEVEDAFEEEILQSPDLFDALLCAYTGSLWPDGLIGPPGKVFEKDGWIYVPK